MPRAVLLTGYGPPEVLRPGEIEVGDPGPAQIRVAVRFAGVGPTDLAIRAGHLKDAFPVAPGAVVGFEAAGVVDAVGAAVRDVHAGDGVAVFLPGLGGYAEMVLADYWVAKPDPVDWADAAALPASGEAAVRVLGQLGVASGETLLLLGGTGSVGTIAAQLAIAHGVRVVAAVAAGDFPAAERLGAIPVEYGESLAVSARSAGGRVDAVMDAAGKGGLDTAIALAGGTRRVITLSDPRAAQLGVTLSGPVAEGIPQALREVMTELAAGRLSLRPHTIVALAQAAEAHARLEQRELRSKVLLAT